MERPLPFFGFSNLCPVLVSERVRLTCIVAVAPLKSTSSHLSPSSSRAYSASYRSWCR
jgi:hypothetical protein